MSDVGEDAPAADVDANADAPAGDAAGARDIRTYLPWAGLLVAVWATLPKYSGPTLTVKGGATTEFVDHIVPGVVTAACCLIAIASQRGGRKTLAPFFCAAFVLLCGLWMVATHWQLIFQATRDEAPWAGAIYHTTAAVAVFGFGLLWTVMHWPDLSAAMAEDDRKRAATTD